MDKKVINIPKRKLNTFFREYLELINPLLKLRTKELDLLGRLMYYNYTISKEFKNPESKLKWSQLFSKDIKDVIGEEIGQNQSILANNLSALRKKKIILNGNKLRSDLCLYPNSEQFVLAFRFNLLLEEEGEEV